jgi:hypothetical protein
LRYRQNEKWWIVFRGKERGVRYLWPPWKDYFPFKISDGDETLEQEAQLCLSMKVTYELSSAEAKSAVVMAPDGSVTITVTHGEAVVPVGPGSIDVIPPPSAGTTIPLTPYSLTGKATWFGLNPDGSDDRGDVDSKGHDLKGAFGDETHNKTIVGISIPIPIFHATIGRGDEVYEDVKARRYLFDVYCPQTRKHATDVWLVDLGPSASLNRTADMTYGLATMLGLKDDAIVTWWVTDTKTGKVLEIKGYDFQNKKVMLA